MKRKHQCIFMDNYLQNLKKTVKKDQRLEDMTVYKLEKSMTRITEEKRTAYIQSLEHHACVNEIVPCF